MDTPKLTLERSSAGHRFDDSLKKLGLDAQVVTWLYSKSAEAFILYVVTDFFDFKGPLEVSRLFFKAYNASAVPQEIDPFNVEFHSIKHIEAGQVASMASVQTYDESGQKHERPRVWNVSIGEDFLWETDWLISKRLFQDRPSVELSRKWKTFQNNINDLAA